MPARRLQRYWVRYTLGAAAGCYCLNWLYRHSWLAGSNDLEDWAREGLAIVIDSWKAHIVKPLVDVRNELFATFRE